MISLLFGFVYYLFGLLMPAYLSYKSLKNEDVESYVPLMMYWVVLAVFRVVEGLSDIFLSFWFPFYYELKLTILVLLLHPFTNISSIFYSRVLQPLIVQHEPKIDGFIEESSSKVSAYLSRFAAFVIRGISHALRKFLCGMVDSNMQSDVNQNYEGFPIPAFFRSMSFNFPQASNTYERDQPAGDATQAMNVNLNDTYILEPWEINPAYLPQSDSAGTSEPARVTRTRSRRKRTEADHKVPKLDGNKVSKKTNETTGTGKRTRTR